MDKEKLYKESLEFINENPNCLSDEVPQYLIDFWATDNFSNEDLEATKEWAIFMHILIFKKEIGVGFEIHFEKFQMMMRNWQKLLLVITFSNSTGVKIKPFRLFDIENIENLELADELLD